MSSSLLTLSVNQPPPSTTNHVVSNNSNNKNINSTLSPVPPSSISTSPCITPQPPQFQQIQQQPQQQQMPVICNKKIPLPSVSIVRNGRKRPALNLPPLHLQPALEHRRRENDARLRDTKAQIEASFLAETTPSSPGGYSNSSDSQPSGSDDDSQNSLSALCSSAKYEKRTRFDSTTPSIYSSTDTLDSELLSGASSTKTSGISDTPDILGADEYLVLMRGDEFQVLEKSTNKLFHAIKMDIPKYKQFMKVAARIESARKYFSAEEFRRLKSRIIPSDTRIVHGTRGISYLLMPSHHASLSFKVKDPNRPKNGSKLSEKEVQSIVFQIVEMMEICHHVGLFFGDFKFDKFVFVDSEK
uniref:Protein kinase domain-containing protein n=1 Tax=Panagrolaimus sp. ES5 TaxID=591445 RepID=A0AC34FI91_9BILA